MKTRMRRILALLILTLLPLASASAQDFPNRPVRFILPYAAGGTGDIIVRLLGNKISSTWGHQLVVDNRTGGGGIIGTEGRCAVCTRWLYALSRYRWAADSSGVTSQELVLQL